MHISPSSKVYIGITSQDVKDRWGNGRGYCHNLYFNRAIKRYGWNAFLHKILFEGLSKEEAEQKEIELIKAYDSANPAYGYNISLGGNYVGKHSERSKRKMSESQTGRKASAETKARQSASHIVRKVAQLDDKGNCLAIWNGAKTAAKALKIPFQNISECLHHAKSGRRHAGGYVWVYEDELHR